MSNMIFRYEPPPRIKVDWFHQGDLEMAANDIILAMDGKIARADARRCAQAAFESLGMRKKRDTQ